MKQIDISKSTSFQKGGQSPFQKAEKALEFYVRSFSLKNPLWISTLSFLFFSIFLSIFLRWKSHVVELHDKRMAELNQQMSELDQELNSLSPYKAEYMTYETQKATIAQRISIIRSISLERETPLKTLDSVSQALPSSVWLDSLEANFSQNTLKFRGFSLQMPEVSDYLTKLSQSIYLDNIELDSIGSHEGVSQGIPYNQFLVHATTKSGS